MLVNVVITVLALGIAAMAGYWAQDRESPIEILAVEPLNAVVAPGEVLKIKYDILRRRDCRVYLEQVAFDSERMRISTPDEDYAASPGPDGEDTFVLAVPIPKSAVEGPGFYRAVRSYYCNPLHTWLNWPIVMRSPDVVFEIRRQM